MWNIDENPAKYSKKMPILSSIKAFETS